MWGRATGLERARRERGGFGAACPTPLARPPAPSPRKTAAGRGGDGGSCAKGGIPVLYGCFAVSTHRLPRLHREPRAGRKHRIGRSSRNGGNGRRTRLPDRRSRRAKARRIADTSIDPYHHRSRSTCSGKPVLSLHVTDYPIASFWHLVRDGRRRGERGAGAPDSAACTGECQRDAIVWSVSHRLPCAEAGIAAIAGASDGSADG
jgi:hypothetical protein